MSRMLIIHHNDLDGRCSAAIMNDYAELNGFSEIECVEVDYKDPGPLDWIKADDTVAIVDFSFKPETMREICNRASRVVWCDHHITAKDYGLDNLEGFRDFSDKGLSGCECTWRFCFPGKPIPRAVQLIGDYDSWRLQMQPECFEFYEGMKIQHPIPTDNKWKDLLLEFPRCRSTTERVIAEVIMQGRAAIRYRDAYCSSIADSYGYETEIDGHKAFAMNLHRFGSKAYGERFQRYPICIAYIHDGKKWTVSLYSETVDVSAIAKAHGGGGHKGAAGFVCDILPFARKE